MFENLFTATTTIERGLDTALKRSQVIANNIANADTPGFKSSSVPFDAVFTEALQQSDGGFTASQTSEGSSPFSSAGLNDSAIQVVQNTGTSMSADGNNVDLDFEMNELAKNTIYYNTLIQKLNSEFSRLEMAINQGGGK